MPLDAESTGQSNKRFTSYDRSALTGLDYAVNRHFDSKQGRFTQVDPLGMRATSLGNPQTLNLYAYCGNDPINRLGPSGLFFGFLKKLFKAIWKGIKVISKVLSNKWVQLALGVALAFLTFGSTGNLIILNLMQHGLKYNTALKVLSAAKWGLKGALAVGTTARAVQSQQQQQEGESEIDPEDVIKITIWEPYERQQEEFWDSYFGPNNIYTLSKRKPPEPWDGRPTVKYINARREAQRKINLKACLNQAYNDFDKQMMSNLDEAISLKPSFADVVGGTATNMAWGDAAGSAAGNTGVGILVVRGINGYGSLLSTGSNYGAALNQCHSQYGY